MKIFDWFDSGQFLLRGDVGLASTLRRRRAQIDDAGARSLWPVYGTSSNGCYALVGTSFGLDVASTRFIITAAHVVNDAGDSMQIALPAAEAIRGEIVTTSTQGSLRSSDALDIAVIRLARNAAKVTHERQFITEHQIDLEPRLEDVGIRGDNPELMYALHGFPSSKHKSVPRKKLKPPEAFVNLAFPTFPEMYEAVGVSPLTHVALKFGHGGAINEAGNDAVPPKLLGLSGGLVWRSDISKPSTQQLRAVAMALEFNRRFRLILCVRLWVVFQLIRAAFPEIAANVPRLATVSEPILFRDVKGSSGT